MKGTCESDFSLNKNKAVMDCRPTFVQALKRSFRVYCENTGLHGFRYIVASESTLDRIVWCTVCTSAIIFCVTLMLRLWEYFSNNPTVTIIDTSNPVRELHFPGITICNNNKVYKPHADKIAQILQMNGFDTDMSDKLLSSLMKLIRPDTIEIDNGTASSALDILGYSVEKLMLEVMQPCNSLLVRCAWLGQIYDCNQIFKTVKSNEGFCCGFNFHFDLSDDYSNEHAWLKNISQTADDLQEPQYSGPLPGVKDILHVPGTGRDVGLAVALNVEAKNYKSSVRQFVGATVLVHDPLDYPDIGAQSASLQPSHVMSVTLAGKKIQSSKDIQNIPLRKRMCLFDGETPGDRRYSYQTCISECLQQKTYGSCGCLPFFFPEERNLSVADVSHISDCNCLPQCTDKFYEVVSESVPVGNVEYDSEITRGLSIDNTSFLYVYFREGTYFEYRKQTILGWDSLLASFGGIFGLCLGGSVISFVEFLYYFVTDFWKIRKQKKGQQNYNNLPLASKLFVSVPLGQGVKKYNTTTVNKRVFFAWNEQQASERNQKNLYNLEPIYVSGITRRSRSDDRCLGAETCRGKG